LRADDVTEILSSMPRRRSAPISTLAATLLLVPLAAACSDDGILWQGAAGQPTAARFPAWVPVIDGALDGAPGAFLIDTGAPMVMADRDSFGARFADGRATAALAVFGLDFPDLAVAVFDLFPGAPDGNDGIDGIVGGELLRHFGLGLDYQGGQLFLDDGAIASGALPPAIDVAAIEAPESIALSLRGGGQGQIPGSCDGGCGGIDVGATRALVEVSLEGSAPVWMLVDTGATNVVLSAALADALPIPAAGSRPRLDGVTVGTAAGPASAYITRVGSIALGADLTAGASSVPALVLEGDAERAIFDGLRDETGVDVVGLLGGSFLRGFAARLDYGGERLTLARYRDPYHIDPDEYVRVGFSLASAPDGGWRIGDVYPGTSAAAAGLQSGDGLERIGDSDLAGEARATVEALLGGAAGDLLLLGVRHAGTYREVSVAIEDLLPPFEIQRARPARREDAP
jgi:hypothetical protein